MNGGPEAPKGCSGGGLGACQGDPPPTSSKQEGAQIGRKADCQCSLSELDSGCPEWASEALLVESGLVCQREPNRLPFLSAVFSQLSMSPSSLQVAKGLAQAGTRKEVGQWWSGETPGDREAQPGQVSKS